jgi:hypothetical protein
VAHLRCGRGAWRCHMLLLLSSPSQLLLKLPLSMLLSTMSL